MDLIQELLCVDDTFCCFELFLVIYPSLIFPDNPLILAGIKPANNKLISPSPILFFIIEIFLIKIMLLLEVPLRCQFLSICPNRF